MAPQGPVGERARGGIKLREAAYESFTERLLARDIAPGQFVTQRELVSLTGMPLGAIRELIPRLEADGLIKTVPQRGMQVAHVDVDLIRNAFQFRLFMEREAVRLFVSAVPDEDLCDWRTRHESVLARAGAGMTAALRDEAQQLDWDMHDAIIDSLGNEIISNAYRVNSIKIRLIRQDETRLHSHLVVSVMSEHLKVLDAFDTRDPDAAAAALAEHIQNAKARALDR